MCCKSSRRKYHSPCSQITGISWRACYWSATKKLQEESTFGACSVNQTGKSNLCNCVSDWPVLDSNFLLTRGFTSYQVKDFRREGVISIRAPPNIFQTLCILNSGSFTSWGTWKRREICHCGQRKALKGQTGAFYGFEKGQKTSWLSELFIFKCRFDSS